MRRAMVGGVATPAPEVVGRPPAAPARPRAEVRPEIQALRALAVAAVVVFHYEPRLLKGGYIGVDVFFAISGFLITSQLLREVDRSGAVNIAGFWARRARRILPAALLVLMVIALVTIISTPQTYWTQYFREIRASTLYVENWLLAHQAIKYSAADQPASPVQHFWSLSAEEQFYLVWPMLILLGAVVARARGVVVRRRTILITLGVVTLASFVFSVADTSADATQAYFITPTRAWEFGLGGLLAVIGTSQAMRDSRRALVSWLGIAMILAAAATFTARTPFPGYAAALPVLGTLLVIWAGSPTARLAPSKPMALRPVQFIGDISYSIYLWHFPLLVMTPLVLNQALHLPTRAALVVLTVLLAWATKVLIEDPMRHGRALTSRKPRYTFALVLVGTGAVFAVCALGKHHLGTVRAQAAAVARKIEAHPPACFGAASHDPAHPCVNPKLADEVVPPPIVAASQGNFPCHELSELNEGLVYVCRFGEPTSRATRTFALVGDSHARMWRAGLDLTARHEHWRGLDITRTGCAFMLARASVLRPVLPACVTWSRQVIDWFKHHPEVGTVFVAQHNDHSAATVTAAPGVRPYAAQVNGYLNAWAALPKTVHHLIVIRDTPRQFLRGATAACVQQAIAAHENAGAKCAVPRHFALRPDPAYAAAVALHSRHVQVINVTRYVCNAHECPPVIGGTLVYKDTNHLTKEFAKSLGPYVLQRVEQLVRGWKPHR
jgi:peptidoglycan/LPS O-acetylase OafA/YrhL